MSTDRKTWTIIWPSSLDCWPGRLDKGWVHWDPPADQAAVQDAGVAGGEGTAAKLCKNLQVQCFFQQGEKHDTLQMFQFIFELPIFIEDWLVI